MASRIATLNTFASLAPPWLLTSLDQNSTNITSAFNDASLGYTNYIATDTGSANNYIVSCLYGTPTAYNAGMFLTYVPAHSNTASSTITVSPLGSVSILRPDGTALIGGELVATVNVTLVSNGTSFVIVALPWVPKISFLGSVSTNQTVDCGNASNVLVNFGFTASVTLTLNNLALGVPVEIQVANTTGGSLTFKIAANLPGGTAYTSINTKTAGVSGSFSQNWLTGVGLTAGNATSIVLKSYLSSGSAILSGFNT